MSKLTIFFRNFHFASLASRHIDFTFVARKHFKCPTFWHWFVNNVYLDRMKTSHNSRIEMIDNLIESMAIDCHGFVVLDTIFGDDDTCWLYGEIALLVHHVSCDASQ